MSFGTVLLPISWSKKGKTQDIFDKFEAGLRTHKHYILRWAKSRDSYLRIASESYRCDLNR